MTTSMVNPERDQDRVADLFELFNKSGQIMFHQQQSIYGHIADAIDGDSVLEAGCGTGLGTSILSRRTEDIVGTDKILRNIEFARATYPWLRFDTWDLNVSTYYRADIVVCVEALEHVGDTVSALRHLIQATGSELWISVPNGTGKPRPPKNPYHVCEYTPPEMINMIHQLGIYNIAIRHWQNFQLLPSTTPVDPLVYHLEK